MELEKLLEGLFDFQRFERDPALQSVIDPVEERYFHKELSDDELSMLSAAGDLEEDLIRKDTLERLAFALKGLAEEEREIIVLHYYKRQTLADISRLTGTQYSQVKAAHQRALKALRKLLAPSRP